jgi:hypothetical protein
VDVLTRIQVQAILSFLQAGVDYEAGRIGRNMRTVSGARMRLLHALKAYQGPREKKLRLSDVKEMFQQMKDHD